MLIRNKDKQDFEDKVHTFLDIADIADIDQIKIQYQWIADTLVLTFNNYYELEQARQELRRKFNNEYAFKGADFQVMSTHDSLMQLLLPLPGKK